MVPEIKVGAYYFIGVVSDYVSTNSITYKFVNGMYSVHKGLNKEYFLKGSNDTKVCLKLRVENHDRENFFTKEWPENCLTTNYCLCEKF